VNRGNEYPSRLYRSGIFNRLKMRCGLWVSVCYARRTRYSCNNVGVALARVQVQCCVVDIAVGGRAVASSPNRGPLVFRSGPPSELSKVD
jgi:hypothetical protein